MTYKIYGGPASPYSMKIRAVFRYLRLPHTWLVPMDGFTGEGGLGEGATDSTLATAGKGVVPVVRFPDGSYRADSTPMMIHLSELVPARSLVHPHAGIAFLSHFIEDMADEFLPRFAAEIRRTFSDGVPEASQNARAELNRFNNSVLEIERTIAASGFLDGLSQGYRTLADTLSDPAVQDAARSLGETLGSMIVTAAEALSFLIENADLAVTAIGGLVIFSLAYNGDQFLCLQLLLWLQV